MALENFVYRQTELLKREEQFEEDEYKAKLPRNFKESTEIFIPYMKFQKLFNQVYKQHCVFEERTGQPLPHHHFSCGDRVKIGKMSSHDINDEISRGIIADIDDKTITVAVDLPFAEKERQQEVFLLKILCDKFYQKIFTALAELHKINSNMIDVAFGYKKPTSSTKLKISEIKFFNENLNTDQKKAVYHAMSQNEISVIHGPPGTGKTTTLVEIILQMVAQGLKVLVCGPSNISVDNIVEKLQKYNAKMIRLGHPSRFLPSAVEYSLDKHTSKNEEINYISNEIIGINDNFTKLPHNDRRWVLEERQKLKKRLREKTYTLEENLLKDVDVVLSTILTDNAIVYHLPNDYFNVVIIDECSKALEAACWVPLRRVGKCVLAGDHLQLPPVIKAVDNVKELEVTIMDRLIDLHGGEISCMLTIQYRMNERIMTWISKQLYDDRLTAHESVANYLLKDLTGVKMTEFTSVPLLMIDTVGCNYEEIQPYYEDSRGNEDEADLLVYYLESLINSGLKPSDIGVITPYNFQVELIKQRLKDTYPEIQVKSVDGFQGREKNAIVLSLVRSNRDGTVGFLADKRRANVAVTRAKRHLAIICDSSTVCRNAFWKEFIDYVSAVGEVHSAESYKNVIKQYPRKEMPQLRNQTKERKKLKNLWQNENVNTSEIPESKSQSRFVENLFATRDEGYDTFYAFVEKFVKSKDSILMLPVTYTASQRKIIHEIAENFGLGHESSGDFPNRQLKLEKLKKKENFKLFTPSENKLKIQMPKKSFGAQSSSHLADPEVKDQKSSLGRLEDIKENLPCDSSVPIICSSEQLQHIRKVKSSESLLEDFEPDVDTVNILREESQRSTGAILKKSPKKRQKLKTVNQDKLLENKDDFERTINSFLQSEKICACKECKKNVIGYMPDCEFCRKKYCSSHSQAEYHGCGDAARRSDKNKFHKESSLCAESNKISAQKHHQNSQNFHKKMRELSAKRKSKNFQTH